MKFRFCGEADCPDWILSEINNLSKLSSVKLKLLTQVVAQGILDPPIDMDKATKLFSDSKLDDIDMDLKASIACLTYILTSTVKSNCDSNALQSELQQLGLPREHSTSIKRVADEHYGNISSKLISSSLQVNPLDKVSVEVDKDTNFAVLSLGINGEENQVLLAPHTVDVLLENLKYAAERMLKLK